MLIIEDVLVSDEVISQKFICNLNACKGACCWEGDYGAPLEEAELDILDTIYEDIKHFLTPEGRAIIEKKGAYTYYEDAEDFGTPLINGGACVYMTHDEQGVAQCGIELAYKAGKTDFKKPISCHLYPIRIMSTGRFVRQRAHSASSIRCRCIVSSRMPSSESTAKRFLKRWI